MANSSAPETTVLAPLDPSKDTNSDDWPDFELNNARVYLPGDRSTTTSLLLASEHYPLTVIGDVQLHAIPKHASHLTRLPNPGRTASVEICDVRTFSYGQYDDGAVDLWAAGRAGWYRIKPAIGYRETFHEMSEAIQLLYFVADAYREERKQGKGKNVTVLPPYSAQALFETYAAEMVGLPKTAAVAAERLYKHVEFLFASMLAGKEGIDWAKSPLYLHLRKKFPAEHTAVVERLAGPRHKTTQRTRQPSIESGSMTSSLKRKRGQPPKNRGADVISVASSSAAGSNGKAVQNPAETSRPTSAPYARPTTSRRTRQVRPSVTESVPEEPADPERTATPVLEISDSDEEPAGRPRKGKSALRLKPSKGAKGKKGASRSGKAPVTEDDGEGGELASSPTAPKRALPDPADIRPSKRRNSKPEVDEGVDMPDSPPATDSPSPSSPDAEPASPPNEPLPNPSSLRHAPDPIQEDTWLCALDGCTHKVYLASQPDSQRLIREHYALHAYDDDERVRMVKRLQAPSLSVERLMEKVRLQARVEGFPGSRVGGSRFPEPVAQRM